MALQAAQPRIAPGPLEEALEVVGLASSAAAAYERPDLLPRLEAAEQRLRDPDLAVLVLGEFKQGKSTLIDALLNAEVCPADDDIATAVPTIVRNGEDLHAVAVMGHLDDLERREISFHDVATYATERHNAARSVDADDDRDVQAVEIQIPRKLLAEGIVLVDTPGVGGLRSQHGEATMAMLATATAALFVTDASQELTHPEMELLRRVVERCENVAVVQTKIDLYPQWRRIVELNRGHLHAAGLDVPILSVASPLRLRAVATSDADLNAESGFPDLLAHLRGEVLAHGAQLAARAAARDVQEVCTQLATTFEAERASLADPQRRAELLDALQTSEERAVALSSANARWQTALNDGVTDLNAEVDHDFRSRIRDLLNDAGERIDAVDPAKAWDEIEPWLRQEVAQQVAGSYDLLAQRSEALARHVAELFLEDQDTLGTAEDLQGPDSVLSALNTDTSVDLEVQNAFNAGLSVLRGSYGGMMMFGMIGGMFGLTLMLPVTVGLGLALGGKGLGEERKRQLQQRRQQAKGVVRSYTDEVSLKVGKDMRDAMRTVHRSLRDGWAQRAGELVQGAQAAHGAAQQAAQVGAQQADARLADIDAELQRITAVHERATALLEDPAP